MPNEHSGGRKHTSLCLGTVVANDDPEKLGRVKVAVPAIVEPESGWAYPLGVGAGKMRGGRYAPPPVGTLVGVWFLFGDVDRPHYIAGHFTQLPDGARATAGPVGGYRGTADEDPAGITPADAPLVQALETSNFVIIVDDRPGKERLVIRAKKSEDEIEFDAVRHGITIKATTALILKADGAVVIEGTTVTVQGRAVLPSAKPLA